MVRIINPGISTIQDEGRFGFEERAVPISGFMDRFSAHLANQLVQNEPHAPLVEILLSDFEFEVLDHLFLSATGSAAFIYVNGKKISTYQCIEVLKGSIVKIPMGERGAINYVSISGNMCISPKMGSNSTYTPACLGGLHGSFLKKRDIVPYDLKTPSQNNLFIHSKKRNFGSHFTARIIKGPEWEYLDRQSQDVFLSMAFTIGQDTSRIGYRIAGNKLYLKQESKQSTYVTKGVIQLPNDGNPIILMADSQVTGGYARIASVCIEDIDYVAQLRPNNSIRFVSVDLDTAKKQISLRKLHTL